MIGAAAAATAHGEAAQAAVQGAAVGLPMALSGFTATAMVIAFLLSGIALLLAFLRLVIGPTLADRVVALDLVTMIIVVVLTLFGMAVDDGAYLDAAIALGLVAFLATVAFARYIERMPRTPVGTEPDSVNDYRAIDNHVEEQQS